MKMRILTSIFFLYIGSAYLFAQEAPTPSVKSAYTAGYWQQEVDYTMNIVVDAPAHQFTGGQRIVYTNNSPDVIDRVFYHLYENIGHYGLAFNHYTHFTSPIRRYSDVLVHRLLFQYLNNTSRVNKERIEKLCKHSSEMEIIASKAERDSIKYMQAVYISKFVGEKLEGIISGVTDFGIFI